ncbi:MULTISPECIES: TIGR03756 family integrating conjugative element protein [Yersinia]|uniref:TIGR03756 family integrating conjugative element protein n=1 Tax=Yersinia TaxID=629 RepID=UPI0022FE7757|nr:TIGR03756 family integrating conjugative element protein [Yersinia kristensenii]MDA5490247.1 TIGR03756 family integrating conjugative element protein [Yersinia kristensenii]
MTRAYLHTRRLLLVTLLIGSNLCMASVNTASLIGSAASTSCISWKVKGICYWLLCTPFGCSVKTSVKVEHFMPEVVVSAYSGSGDNPWSEMSVVSGAAGATEKGIISTLAGVSAGGGQQAIKAPSLRKQNLHFHYADAYGHPATALIGGQITGYSCQSTATPFMPYFVSAFDSLAWRSGLPESLYPEALIPGQRELGRQRNGNMWGNIYPRSGFVTQQDSYKSAAVVAQRVADIITRRGQLHVYRPLVGQSSLGYWPPESVRENTGTHNHKWQRLAPKISTSCAIFPDTNYPIAEDGNYAWSLWRPYRCCQRRGQTFLSSTDFS